MNRGSLKDVDTSTYMVDFIAFPQDYSSFEVKDCEAFVGDFLRDLSMVVAKGYRATNLVITDYRKKSRSEIKESRAQIAALQKAGDSARGCEARAKEVEAVTLKKDLEIQGLRKLLKDSKASLEHERETIDAEKSRSKVEHRAKIIAAKRAHKATVHSF